MRSKPQTIKQKRHKPEEVIRLLREHDASGLTQEDFCRQKQISVATLNWWRKKDGQMDEADAKRLKALEKENAELKKMFAEAMCKRSTEPPLQRCERWYLWRLWCLAGPSLGLAVFFLDPDPAFREELSKLTLGRVVHEFLENPLEVAEGVVSVAPHLLDEGVDDGTARARLLSSDKHPILRA